MILQNNLKNLLKVTWQIAGKERRLVKSLVVGANILQELHKDQFLVHFSYIST